MYINDLDNAQIISHSALRTLFSAQSIPPDGTNEISGWFKITETALPSHDRFMERVHPDGYFKSMGIYVTKWVTTPLNPGERQVMIDSAKDSMWLQVWNGADNVKQQAEATFVSAMGSMAIRNADRIEKQFLRVVSKIVREAPTTPGEDAFYLAYDGLLDFIEQVDDTAGNSCDTVNAMSTGAEVEAFDLSAIQWPVWV